MINVFNTLFIKIMKKLEKISKNIKNEAYPNKCNWKGVNYTLVKDDQKNFEKNNPRITLNVFYTKKMNIYPAYISKQLKS